MEFIFLGNIIDKPHNHLTNFLQLIIQLFQQALAQITKLFRNIQLTLNLLNTSHRNIQKLNRVFISPPPATLRNIRTNTNNSPPQLRNQSILFIIREFFSNFIYSLPKNNSPLPNIKPLK